MIYTCKRLVKKYPNFSICVGGFCLMVAPAVLGGALLSLAWFIENRADVSLFVVDGLPALPIAKQDQPKLRATGS